MDIKVVKIGGNVVDNPLLLDKFLADFAQIESPKILVHGGGVMASQMQKKMGMEAIMIDGRRVTDEETLKVVTMVYAGWCNKNIVTILQKYSCNAIGLCGADASVIKAHKRDAIWSGTMDKMVDYGYVGDVKAEGVNTEIISQLLSMGLTPVFSAINHDGQGNLLNTNADTIASSLAVALANHIAQDGGKLDLIFCFEKDGVLRDKDDNSSLIPEINSKLYEELKSENIVNAGMLPKLENAFKAISQGVNSVIIKSSENLLNNIGTILKL